MHRDASYRLSVRGWLPPLVWAGVILFGTSLPGETVPVQTSGVDKYLHFAFYTVLGLLLTRQISEASTRWRAAALAIVIALAFAAADEWHQRFIPGRSTELADWIADSLGAAVGALTVAAFRRTDRSRAMATE
jgi:VanZ family protein